MKGSEVSSRNVRLVCSTAHPAEAWATMHRTSAGAASVTGALPGVGRMSCSVVRPAGSVIVDMISLAEFSRLHYWDSFLARDSC